MDPNLDDLPLVNNTLPIVEDPDTGIVTYSLTGELADMERISRLPDNIAILKIVYSDDSKMF